MNVFSNSCAHLLKELRALSVSARIAAGLLLTLVVVSLGYLLSQQVATADMYLMNGEPIAAGQLPTLEAAFAKASLNDYEVEGNRIKIPRGRNSLYMAALADAGALPANFGSYFDQMLKQAGPFVNRAQQEEMIKVARQHELALIIQSMKGYERAAVMYDTQKKSGLHGGQIVTASVNVKAVGNQTLDREQIGSLRNLLAGAIAGLEPRNVAVTDLNSGRTYYATGDTTATGSDSYVARKQEYEQLWSEKLRQSLEMIPNVVVTVNVELDPDVVNEQTTVEFEKPTPDGAKNGPMSDALTYDRRDASSTQAGSDAPGTRRTTVHKVPLRPLHATVAVGIPSSYVDQVWRHQHPQREGAVAVAPDARAIGTLQADIVAKVEAHVKNLLPGDADRANSRVNVTTTIFQDVAEKIAVAEPDASALALDWVSRHDTLLAVGGLVLFSLVALRSMLRATPVKANQANSQHLDSSGLRASTSASPNSMADSEHLSQLVQQLAAHRVDAATAGPPAPAAMSSRGMTITPDESQQSAPLLNQSSASAETQTSARSAVTPSLRDQLAEMVRHDPDAAARVLRSWIGSTT